MFYCQFLQRFYVSNGSIDVRVLDRRPIIFSVFVTYVNVDVNVKFEKSYSDRLFFFFYCLIVHYARLFLDVFCPVSCFVARSRAKYIPGIECLNSTSLIIGLVRRPTMSKQTCLIIGFYVR